MITVCYPSNIKTSGFFSTNKIGKLYGFKRKITEYLPGGTKRFKKRIIENIKKPSIF